MSSTMSWPPASMMRCHLLNLLIIVAVFTNRAESLGCYSCAPTPGIDVVVANTDCLANGTETVCPTSQDRCYSLVESDTVVEKGCTRAENCIGNRICCQTDFCNAGYGAALKTGYGQPCERETSCVLDEGMVCQRATTEAGQLPRCLCSYRWFPIGAVCLPQSDVGGLCFEDSHCRLENSFCQFQRCQCAPVFFPNYTSDVCQLKVPILKTCSEDVQCRPEHAVCQQRCVCDIGYVFDDFSGHCSGSCRAAVTSLTWLMLAVVLNLVLVDLRPQFTF